MAVLNATPDSFSDGGRFAPIEAGIAHGRALVAAGAAVLDIGGESTRPGHRPVAADVQCRRILPILAGLRPQVAVPISIDTTRADVARAALDAGADWINDVSALQDDPEMAEVVAAAGCPVVLMHRFDPPRRPGDDPRAALPQILDTLGERLRAARRAGIADEQILLDPGLGFGTLPADNVTILAGIGQLRVLGRPLVVGPSRKSFLGHLTGKEVGERLMGTAACVAALALAAVELVRVHDVEPLLDVVKVSDAIAKEGRQ